jgi:hypothetical protein
MIELDLDSLWKTVLALLVAGFLLAGLYVVGLSLAFVMWALPVIAAGAVIYFAVRRFLRWGVGV